MRAFRVKLPSGVCYWTVLDDDLVVVDDADAFLRHLRFGRDGSELTTRSYAGAIALFLRWCSRTGRHWHAGVEQLGLFMVWLQHAGPEVSGLDVETEGLAQVMAGPGTGAGGSPGQWCADSGPRVRGPCGQLGGRTGGTGAAAVRGCQRA